MKPIPLVLFVASVALTQTQAPAAPASAVDAVFARWTTATPGCAVGVGVGRKAGPRARLRHGRSRARSAERRRTRSSKPDRCRSSSRRPPFCCWRATASCRWTIRSAKYIPELPDYGVPLTIRHMLTHTSGLRDWGAVGRSRDGRATTRVYTHAHVLDIVVAAEGAQFHAGHEVVVQQHRLQPGGDHRVARQRQAVRGLHARAHLQAARHDAHVMARRLTPASSSTAPSPTTRPADGYHAGHAVRERARQRRAADDGRRSAAVERELRDTGRRRRGVRGGAADAGTLHRRARARLRAWDCTSAVSRRAAKWATADRPPDIARISPVIPNEHVSVAVLCNAGNANATQYAHAVADVYLGDGADGCCSAGAAEQGAAAACALPSRQRAT